jgi:hypothetical protein
MSSLYVVKLPEVAGGRRHVGQGPGFGD